MEKSVINLQHVMLQAVFNVLQLTQQSVLNAKLHTYQILLQKLAFYNAIVESFQTVLNVMLIVPSVLLATLTFLCPLIANLAHVLQISVHNAQVKMERNAKYAKLDLDQTQMEFVRLVLYQTANYVLQVMEQNVILNLAKLIIHTMHKHSSAIAKQLIVTNVLLKTEMFA